jgi:hypothetical protein
MVHLEVIGFAVLDVEIPFAIYLVAKRELQILVQSPVFLRMAVQSHNQPSDHH